jgi:hypothetical protein
LNKKIISLSTILFLLIQIPVFVSEETNCDFIKIKNSYGKYQLYDSIDYSKYGDFSITENGMILTDDEWYYYPPYPNYSPSGMPDFTNTQNDWYDDNDRNNSIGCSTYSFANIIWYLDSMYSDPLGLPGDGRDIFNLVEDYNAPSIPDPGPLTDDHNYNNVNDPLSLWDPENNIYGNELIERIRMYTGPGYATEFEEGLNSYIEDLNLSHCLKIEAGYYSKFRAPTLDGLYKYINRQAVVVLGLDWRDSNYRRVGGHTITLSGININESLIAVSDSARDFANPINNNILHNNPLYVSHDIYEVFETFFRGRPILEIKFWSPYVESEYCYIEDFFCIIPNMNHPTIPMIYGEIEGSIGIEYWYNISSSDNDNDDIYFYIEWGDNTTSDWIGPYKSGNDINVNHTWYEKGQYKIKVKAKDEFDAESDWATLEVSMPKKKTFNFIPSILIWLFEHFPFLQQYLSYFIS